MHLRPHLPFLMTQFNPQSLINEILSSVLWWHLTLPQLLNLWFWSWTNCEKLAHLILRGQKSVWKESNKQSKGGKSTDQMEWNRLILWAVTALILKPVLPLCSRYPSNKIWLQPNTSQEAADSEVQTDVWPKAELNHWCWLKTHPCRFDLPERLE